MQNEKDALVCPRSVPTKRVFCCYGGRDEGCTAGIAVAPATAVTVSSTTGNRTIVGEVLTHKRTTHQSRAASLTHRVGVGEGAGSSARHLSPLIFPGDEEHQSSVSTCECSRPHSDTCNLGLGA